MRIRNFVFGSAIALASASAFAGDFYVLGSLGKTRLESNADDIGREATSAGFSNVAVNLDDTSSGYKMQLGYLFNPNFAIEGGYMNLGKFRYDVTATGIAAQQEFKASGFNITALGIMPLNDTTAIFAKLGTLRSKAQSSTQARNTVTGATVSAHADDRDWNSILGLGAAYKVSRDIDIRFEFESIQKIGDPVKTGQSDVRLLSLGVAYRF